jgi:L-ornithine N5-oxygenase
VELRGRARILRDSDVVVSGLRGIAAVADPSPNGFRPTKDAAGDECLFSYLVGFDIEIDQMTERFKPSQDRDDADRCLASRALGHGMERDGRELIASSLGLMPEVEVARPNRYAMDPI